MSIVKAVSCGWDVDYRIEQKGLVLNCADAYQMDRSNIFDYDGCQGAWDNQNGTELAQHCPEQCRAAGQVTVSTCGTYEGNGYESNPSVVDSVCPDDPAHEFDVCYASNINAATCNQDDVIPYMCPTSCLAYISPYDQVKWVQDKISCDGPSQGIDWPYDAEDCCDDADFKWANGDCWGITEEDDQAMYDRCTRDGTDSCAAVLHQCTLPGFAGEIARKHCPRTCQIYVVGKTETSQQSCHMWGDSCDGGSSFPDANTEDPTDPEVVDPTDPEVVDPTDPEIIDPTDPEVVDPTDPEIVDPTEPEGTVDPEVTEDPVVPSRPPYVPKPIPQTKPMTRPVDIVTEAPVETEATVDPNQPVLPTDGETTSTTTTTTTKRGGVVPPPVGPPPVVPGTDTDEVPTESPQDEEDSNVAVIAGATAGVVAAGAAGAAAFFKMKKPSPDASAAGDVDTIQEVEERDAVASVNDEMFM